MAKTFLDDFSGAGSLEGATSSDGLFGWGNTHLGSAGTKASGVLTFTQSDYVTDAECDTGLMYTYAVYVSHSGGGGWWIGIAKNSTYPGTGFLLNITATDATLYRINSGAYNVISSASHTPSAGLYMVTYDEVTGDLVGTKDGVTIVTGNSTAEPTGSGFRKSAFGYDGGTNAIFSEFGYGDVPVYFLVQEGAGWYLDDAAEASSSPSQSQDTNDTVALGVARVLRTVVNATLDPPSLNFTLYAQKNGTGGYFPVPVGPSTSEAYGTATFGAVGTGANGSTTVAPSYPSGITAGQYLLAVVTSGSTGDATPTDSGSKWGSPLATGASSDGTYGVDAGPRRVTVFGCIADGTETGTYTFNISGGGTCRGTIYRFTKAGSGSWAVEAQGGDDSSSGTDFSATMASMNWNTGDAALVAVGQRVDSVTQSSQSLTASGVTFGTRTNRASTAVTTGNDHRHVVDTFDAVSSTSDIDAAPTWAYTGSGSCSGGVVVVRLREYTAPVTHELYIANSSNITDGEARTARLTAPSGKSSGSDFEAGKINDATNAITLNLGSGKYSELARNLKTQAPAADGDYWDLREYAGSTPFGTYTVTLRLTLASGITAAGTDTNTPTDSAVALTDRVAAGTDTNTPTDSAVSVSTRVAEASDTNTPTDSAAVSGSPNLTASDTITLSDSAVALGTLIAVAADTNTPTDSAVGDISGSSAATDTNTPTDAAVGASGILVGTPDTTAANRITASPDIESGDLIQVRSYLGGAVPTIYSDATFSFGSGVTPVAFEVRVWDHDDGTWGSWAVQSILSGVEAEDTISFTDSGVATPNRVAVAADTNTPSDSAVSVSNLVSVSADTNTPTDTAVSITVRLSVAADTLTPTDAAQAITGSAAAGADTLSFSDAAAALMNRVSEALDTLTPTDAAVSVNIHLALAADSLSLSDAASVLSSMVITAIDTLTFSDSAFAGEAPVPAAPGSTVPFHIRMDGQRNVAGTSDIHMPKLSQGAPYACGIRVRSQEGTYRTWHDVVEIRWRIKLRPADTHILLELLKSAGNFEVNSSTNTLTFIVKASDWAGIDLPDSPNHMEMDVPFCFTMEFLNAEGVVTDRFAYGSGLISVDLFN